jgi:hypothetical protein
MNESYAKFHSKKGFHTNRTVRCDRRHCTPNARRGAGQYREMMPIANWFSERIARLVSELFLITKKPRSFILIGLFIFGGLAHHESSAAPQYLLLNYSPDGFSTYHSSSTIMNYVAQKYGAANQTSSLKVGVACIYYAAKFAPSPQNELNLLRSDLARAEDLGIPILVQVDTEIWLPTYLLNWYDPALPGYDPAKSADVDWYGWDPSTAVKLSWRNWGFPFRVGPAPNFLSPRFQAFEKSLYDLFLPVVLQWYNNLPANKKWLFVGWKCGWESSINTNYRFFQNGNSYYGTANDPEWDSIYQSLGYNAAKTAGIRTNGMITTSDLAKIIGLHLSFLSKLAFEGGIPKEKIYAHGTHYSTAQQNMDALVNLYSNPGASFYESSSTPLKTKTALMQAVNAAKTLYDATGYAYSEFNLFTTDYLTWYKWFQNALHDDPNCGYQALFNYDSVYGRPSVEQALLDAMALYPAESTPAIFLQPASLTVLQGSNAIFTVGATEPGTLSYQWRFYESNIPGATAPSFSVSNVQPGRAGNYSVIVSNSSGSVTSKVVFLSIELPATNNPGCVPAPSGLMNWWPADGNGNDLMGNLNAIPRQGLSYGSGKSSLAFRFDGATSWARLSGTNLPAPWTVCCWVKRENAPGTSGALMADGTYSLKLEQHNSTRTVGITHRGVADYLFSPAYIAPVATWVHLAFVGTATNTTLYANGVLVGSMSASIPLPRAYIGASYAMSLSKFVDYLAGDLDEILVFNRALAASEIGAIHAAGSAGFYRVPEISKVMTVGNNLHVDLAGLSGKSFTIYSSSNLLDWKAVTSLAAPYGTNTYDASFPSTTRQFYRVSQP